MKRTISIIGLLTMVVALPAMGLAQVDNFGTADTLFAEVAKVNDLTWSITVSYTNDEWVEALSIPLKIDGGAVPVVGDSAVYTGGRVEDFNFKGFRADTAVQCVTMGMVANMGPTKYVLEPGSGRIVTVFVSSPKGMPIEKLTVDTTTTHPNNSLMVMAKKIQPGTKSGDPSDTIPLERFKELEITPVFVVRQAK